MSRPLSFMSQKSTTSRTWKKADSAAWKATKPPSDAMAEGEMELIVANGWRGCPHRVFALATNPMLNQLGANLCATNWDCILSKNKKLGCSFIEPWWEIISTRRHTGHVVHFSFYYCFKTSLMCFLQGCCLSLFVLHSLPLLLDLQLTIV